MRTNRRKYLQGMLLAGFLLAAVLISGRSASAGERIPSGDITLDYARQLLEVTTTDDEVMVAFPTVKIVEDEIVSVTVKKWDIYDSELMTVQEDESRVAVIDLSRINVLKGGYVAVKTNATEQAALISFRGVHTKLKAHYDTQKGSVEILDRLDDDNPCDALFEYKTLYGTWYDYNAEETSLRTYEQQGAVLYFREKCGYDDGDEKVTRGSLALNTIADKVGEVDAAPEFCLYEAVNTFSGRELKIKVPKRREGTSVAVNYQKRTIKVKKGSEYRQDSSSEFEPAETATTINVGEEAGVVEVRLPEYSNKKGYTPVSKITRYEYPASRVMKIRDYEQGITGTRADQLYITYNSETKRVECCNSDMENAYYIYAVKPGGAAPVLGSRATAMIKAAKEDKDTVVILKKSKLPAGYQVYVSYVADSKNKKWATEPVLLGTVR